MPIIARSDPSVAISPTPLRAVDTGASAIGQATEHLGASISRYAEKAKEERDDLDMFQTKMTLTNFHGEQDLRQREYDADIQGDGRNHTAGRLSELDQNSQAILGGLPNNQKARQFAALQLQTMRSHFGERSYVAQQNHINTYKGSEVENTAVVKLVPRVTNDPAQIDPLLRQFESMLDGAKLPRAQADQIRAKVASLMVERFRESGIENKDVDLRAKAETIIKGYQDRIGKEQPAADATALIEKGSDLSALISIHSGLTSGDGKRSIDGLSKPFVGNFASMLQAMPPELRSAVEINEAHRTNAYQAELYNRYKSGQGGIAAPPGQSRHNVGEAVDLSPVGGFEKAKTPEYKAALEWIYKNGGQYGIENPSSLRTNDPHHFQLTPNAPSLTASAQSGAAGTETAQFQTAAGEPSTARLDMSKTDGFFLRGLIHNLSNIDKDTAKLREQLAANQLVDDATKGAVTVNPNDDATRKTLAKAPVFQVVADRMFKGDQPTIDYAVGQAQKMNFVEERVGDALKGMIDQKGDAGLRLKGLNAASAIIAKTPFAFEATKGGKEVAKNAQQFEALTRVMNYTAPEALKKMDLWSSSEFQQQKELNETDLKSFKSGLTDGDLRHQFDRIPWVPFTDPVLQKMGAGVLHGSTDAVMLDAYQKLAEEAFLRTRDRDYAKAEAVAQLSRTWGISDVTGTGTVMQHPPETRYPAVGGKHDYLNADLQKTVTDWLKATGRPTSETITTGVEAPVSVKGRVEVLSDAQTDREVKAAAPGTMARPSYALVYRDDKGVPQRIMALDAQGKLIDRWRPDAEGPMAELQAKEKAARKGAAGDRSRATDAAAGLTSATGAP